MNLKLAYNPKYFIFLLIGIVVIRYIGVWYGYPFIYNVDEPTLVRATLDLRFTPWIDKFDWPHFNYYFHFVFYWLFIKLRAAFQLIPGWEVGKSMFPVIWQDEFVFYVISRIINTSLSLVSAIPIYKLIRKLTMSELTAKVSVLLYLLLPYAMYHSRMAIQDTALTTWLAFYIYYLYLYFENNKRRTLLIAVVFLGIAMGVKYNALLFLALIPLVTLWRLKVKETESVLRFLKVNILSVLIFLGVFVMTTPSVIYNWPIFWSTDSGAGFLWQIQNNLRTYPLAIYPGRLVEDLVVLIKDLGFVPFILWIASFYYIRFYPIDKAKKYFLYIIAGFAVLYALNAARYTLSGSRFYLPIYPLIITSGASVIWFYRRNLYLKYGLIFTTFGLFIGAISSALLFSMPTTLNIAYDRYVQLSKLNTVYIKAEDMERLNLLNQLKLKTLRDNTILKNSEYVISSREIQLDNYSLELIETITSFENSSLAKTRLGPDIFVYQVKEK